MFSPRMAIYAATAPVDLRRAFDSLAPAAREQLGHDPKSGALLLFRQPGGRPTQGAVVGSHGLLLALQAFGARDLPHSHAAPARRQDDRARCSGVRTGPRRAGPTSVQARACPPRARRVPKALRAGAPGARAGQAAPTCAKQERARGRESGADGVPIGGRPRSAAGSGGADCGIGKRGA
jgi:hypothetical protein